MPFPLRTSELNLTLNATQSVTKSHALSDLPDGYRVKSWKVVMEGDFTYDAAATDKTPEFAASAFSKVEASILDEAHKVNLSGQELAQVYVNRHGERFGNTFVADAGNTSENRIETIWEPIPPMGGELDWNSRIPTGLIGENDHLKVTYTLNDFAAELTAFSGVVYIEAMVDFFDGEYIPSTSEQKSISNIEGDLLKIPGKLATIILRNRAFERVDMDGLYMRCDAGDLDRMAHKHWEPLRSDGERTTRVNILKSTLGTTLGGGELAFCTLFDRRDHKLFEGAGKWKFEGLPTSNGGYIQHTYQGLV